MASFTNRILWWSLVVSLLLYVVVAHVVNLRTTGTAPVALLAPILVLMSIGVAVGSLVFRRRALSGPIQSGELDPSTPAGLQRAFTPFIVNLVLSESVGIYGLVLAFLSGNPTYSIAFGGAALALMYLHRPTAPDLVPPVSGPQRGSDSTPIG